MTDTNQLPEPELGYIQTDKSNQPAFSARQMREAMLVCGAQNAESDPQAPLSLTPEPVLTVEKEPDYWSGGHFHKGDKPHINPMKVWSLPIGTKLYTTPQPAQATQAEVTDAAIDAATRHIYHAGRPTSKEYRVGIARAILALRHQAAVQMTCHCHTCRPITMDDMRMVLCPKCGNKRCPHANDHRNDCTGSNEPGQPGSAYPAHHGITAQDKKETP